MPSRLFIYYNERAMEGSIGTDSGAQIRDGVKSVAKLGVCPETEWPYDGTPANSDGTFPANDPAAEKPTDTCYKDALDHRATTYSRVLRDLDQMKALPGRGVSVRLRVHGLHELRKPGRGQDRRAVDAETRRGRGRRPRGARGRLRRRQQTFLVRNSWGAGWGQAGYFTMPYAYLTTRGLSSDFWTIRIVT